MAKNFTLPVIIGASEDTQQKEYHIDSTPAIYLLDENGRVLMNADGTRSATRKLWKRESKERSTPRLLRLNQRQFFRSARRRSRSRRSG